MSSGNGPSVAPLKVASLITLAVFTVLAGRLFFLQFVKAGEYRILSEQNYIVQVAIKAPRGDIVDHTGRVIAGSRQSFSICGVPRLMLRNRREIACLATLLGVSEDYVISKLKRSAMSFRPTPVVRDVDFATLSMVEEHYADLPNVIVMAEPVRYYPDGYDFCHLVGYVGEVSQAEIDEGGGRYGPGDFTGKAGLEKEYERYLAGLDGTECVKFSVAGGSSPADIVDFPTEQPRRGMRLVLNTDYDLQMLAQNLLVGVRGCIVALDVETGGVLALASSPAFDPSAFVSGVTDEEWSAMTADVARPLLNRAIQCAYPPGSTYKIVTASVALELNMISEHTSFQACRGALRFGNRTFSCWKKEGHGTSDLVRAVAVSCDVYFYQLGERLGLDAFAALSRKWHLGEPSGIDLPAEAAGLVPTRAYYDGTYGKGKWSRGVMLNLAIGQGEILVTPIQLACFVSALANSGTYFVPTCVARIESGSSTLAPERQTVVLPISPYALQVVRSSMLQAVEGAEGTGRAARIPDIQVAGKTGTAQNPHGDDHAWFVCFAPYDDPEIAVCVVIENGGHGGAVSAPRARDLLMRYFGRDMPDTTRPLVAGSDWR